MNLRFMVEDERPGIVAGGVGGQGDAKLQG
jgi:hypothetical protein